MQKALSTDGTEIAFDTVGEGPAVIVIGGAMNTRHSPYPLVTLLGEKFAVTTYDRRGRGDSTDVAPYAVEREVEDLAAVIDAVGGSAMVYGHSSGAILTLEAAAAGLPITRIAVYEPPYTGNSSEPSEPDTVVADALATGDRDAATAGFMRLTGMPDGQIEWMRHSDFWPDLVALAHTLPYDLALSGNGVVPTERLAGITAPTLAMDGGASDPWAALAADAVVTAVANGERETLAGQTHQVDQAVLATSLGAYFGR
jgi:pimeloyl-ACP methyl ester carboxylesterase